MIGIITAKPDASRTHYFQTIKHHHNHLLFTSAIQTGETAEYCARPGKA